MTIRQISILNKLKSSPSAVSQQELASLFSVGVRTIQNDLKTISFYLKESGIGALRHIYGEGVVLEFSKEEEEKLERLISKLSNESNSFDVSVRREQIIKRLVLCDGNLKLSDLSNSIGMSRGTILNDLRALREEISREGETIKILSRPGRGIKLEGNEGAIREFHLKKYFSNVNASCLSTIESYHKASIVNRFYEIRGIEETAFIFSSLERAVLKSKRMLTGNAFLELISRIELAIERIKLKQSIELAPFYLESVYGTPEYHAMYEMSEEIGKRLKVCFNLEEVGYFAFLLLGSNIVSVQQASCEENFPEIQVAVFKLMSSVEKELSIEFSTYPAIYNDLVYHIRPAVFRIHNGIMQKNPLKEEIKKKYPDIFKAVKESIQPLETCIGVVFPDDEICYIAVHFAAAREHQIKNTLKSPDILIVCDSGIGTSNLLASRIVSLFDVNVVDTIAYYELERALCEYEVEYIVSSLPLDYEDKKVIKVNPLITDKDMETLGRYFKKRRCVELEEEKFIEVLQRNCDIRDVQGLKKDLYREFSLIFKSSKKDTKDVKMLLEVMHKNMMELDYDAKDWEAAVRESGRLLMDGGCIGQQYIESMVETVRKMGSYIVISEGIALPHSRSGDNAFKVGISLLRLKKPVVFGHPENDPVDLVFGLSSIDSKAHLGALRDFSKILSNTESLKTIRAAKSIEEVYDYLVSIEKEKEK